MDLVVAATLRYVVVDLQAKGSQFAMAHKLGKLALFQIISSFLYSLCDHNEFEI